MHRRLKTASVKDHEAYWRKMLTIDFHEGKYSGGRIHSFLHDTLRLKSIRRKSLIKELKANREIQEREDNSLVGSLTAAAPGFVDFGSNVLAVLDLTSDLRVLNQFRVLALLEEFTPPGQRTCEDDPVAYQTDMCKGNHAFNLYSTMALGAILLPFFSAYISAQQYQYKQDWYWEDWKKIGCCRGFFRLLRTI